MRFSMIIAAFLVVWTPAFAQNSEVERVADRQDDADEHIRGIQSRLRKLEDRVERLENLPDGEDGPNTVVIPQIHEVQIICAEVNGKNAWDAYETNEDPPDPFVCLAELERLEREVNEVADILLERKSFAGGAVGVGVEVLPVPGHWVAPTISADAVWGAETKLSGYTCGVGGKGGPNLFSIGAGFTCANYHVTRRGNWAHGVYYGGSITDLASMENTIPYFDQRAYAGSVGSYNRLRLGREGRNGATYILFLGGLNAGVLSTAPGADPNGLGYEQGFLGAGFAVKIQHVRFNADREDDGRSRRSRNR